MGQVQFLPDHHLTQAWASNSELKGRPYSIGFNSTGCKFWLSLVSQGVGDKLFSLPTCTHLHLNNGDNSSGFWESSRQWCDMLSAPPHTHTQLPFASPTLRAQTTACKDSHKEKHLCFMPSILHVSSSFIIRRSVSPKRLCVP